VNALADKRPTRIGLGTNRLTNTPQNRAFLQGAVEAGIDFIDTAHLYSSGESERAIGEALAPFEPELTVASKGAYAKGSGPDDLRKHVAESLERLRTERLELYYVHRLQPQHSVGAMVSILAEYVDAGSIAHVGVSEVTIEEIELAQTVVPIAAVQNQYSLGERMHDEVVDFCAAQEILFVPFFPLRGGNARAIGEVAAAHGATPHQIKLAWLLKRSPVMLPIPGTLSLDHLRENLGALELELSDEEFERLHTA
jgi:aryl-alcohol dehydrogenase-like predicted oxidoreductase